MRCRRRPRRRTRCAPPGRPRGRCRGDGVEAEDGPGQLAAAGTDQAVEPEDLPGRTARETSRWPPAVATPRSSSAGVASRSTVRASSSMSAWARPTMRSTTSLRVSPDQRQPLGDAAAVAQDRDGVGDGEDLLELVADEDHRATAVAQPTHDGVQVVGLVGGQRGRRLVEQQDAALGGERLGDLDQLHLRDRQLDDGRSRSRLTSSSARQRAASSRVAARSTRPRLRGTSCRAMFSATEKPGTRLRSWCTTPMPAAWACDGPEKESSSPSPGPGGVGRAGRVGQHAQRPAVGAVHPGEHLDQGALAGAVLAQQGVHGAGSRSMVTPSRARTPGKTLTRSVASSLTTSPP